MQGQLPFLKSVREAQKEQIELAILQEKVKEDRISKKDIISWLTKMKSVDLSVDVNKRHFVDKYISHIVMDGNRLLIYFKLREDATKCSKISESCRLGEPPKTNPNTFIKCSGFVFYPGKAVFGVFELRK